MKHLTLMIIFALAACARAEWQETPAGRAQQQQGQTPPEDKPPGEIPETESFAQCKSQTLRLRVSTQKSQDGLQSVASVLAKYPQIHVAESTKTKMRSVFLLSAQNANQQACEDETCAQEAGWSQVQLELRAIEDVTVKCLRRSKVPHTLSTLSRESIFQE